MADYPPGYQALGPAVEPVYSVDISAALLPTGAVPLSLNGRLSWPAHARAVARVKAVTRNAVMAAQVPHLGCAHVELHYRPKVKRFRDVDNIVATLKPAMDALHSRDESPNHPVPFDPIIDGDDTRYVTWEPPILHATAKGEPAALWLVLTALWRDPATGQRA